MKHVAAHRANAACAAGAMSAGASWYEKTPAINASFAVPVLNDFSSWGTTPLLFDVSGTRLAEPVVLQKPDIVGPGTYTCARHTICI